jgi:hypothetical protein
MSHSQPSCLTCSGTGYITVSVLTRRHGICSTEASCPTCFAPPEARVREWRAAYRWHPIQTLCRHCGEWTHLRDDEGLPAHWLCAAKAAPNSIWKRARNDNPC